MGLLSFIKDAGEKLFKRGQEMAADAGATLRSDSTAAAGQGSDEQAARSIKEYIAKQNLPAEKLKISYDGSSSTVTVQGTVPDQTTREKIVLCCGNVSSVEHVNDQMNVETPATEARYYTVKSGDTLSRIAREMYGDANKYTLIFEANQPMLDDPDKIYPGQTLRIPSALP